LCAVHRFSLSSTELLITVDNGINAYREILLAQRLGVDVIVTDHLRIQEQAKTLAVGPRSSAALASRPCLRMALASVASNPRRGCFGS
jgi:hypothetical protein